MLTAV